jgi:hypothetical protein
MRWTHRTTAALVALSLGMTLGLVTASGLSAQATCIGLLDVDGDGLADTPVGSPGESVGRIPGAGSVTVFSANPNVALGAGAVITQNSTGVPDAAEAGDGFGSGLTVMAA